MALSLPEDPDFETAQDLARWLEESGRRKRRETCLPTLPQLQGQRHAKEPVVTLHERPRYLTQPALLCLFGMATASFLFYYYAAVNLKILSLWSVVVFVGA